MSENLITVQELTDYAPDLDITQFSATTISGMIARASARIAGFCAVDGFFKTAVTSETGPARINTDGDLIISPRRMPVDEGDVTRITLRDADVRQDLTLQSGTGISHYLIESPGRIIKYKSQFFTSFGYGLLVFRNANMMYEMDYTGGYATDVASIPADLKEATTLLVREQLNMRNNPTGATGFTQGNYSVRYSADAQSSFVKQAKQILNEGDYVRRIYA